MKKVIFPVICLVLAFLLLSGCEKRIDYSLPEEPIEVNSGEFTDPDNIEITESDTFWQ